MDEETSRRAARARLAVEGVTLGDALGASVPDDHLARWLDEGTPLSSSGWSYTDDGIMACGILEVLHRAGHVDPDDLAETFARHYAEEPWRGYGPGAHRILRALSRGGEWRELSGAAFGGAGSLGNGGAMRAAPVGGWYADDPERAAEEGARSAEVTHAHPEGCAGGAAVAVAAAAAWRTRGQPREEAARAVLDEVLRRTPAGDLRAGLEEASRLPLDRPVAEAAHTLGNGAEVIAADTVPLSVWCAARHLDDLPTAIARTALAGGDRDTTTAIVGGIVACRLGPEGLPAEWLERREPLPAWVPDVSPGA